MRDDEGKKVSGNGYSGPDKDRIIITSSIFPRKIPPVPWPWAFLSGFSLIAKARKGDGGVVATPSPFRAEDGDEGIKGEKERKGSFILM